MTNVPATTNDAGIPVESDGHSLRVGADGPVLLQDHYFIEKTAQFDRERVPERVVHAGGQRGVRAHPPGTPVCTVLDDAARRRLVDNVGGHCGTGVNAPVPERTFDCRRSIDQQTGDRIAAAVKGA
jgi:catalase